MDAGRVTELLAPFEVGVRDIARSLAEQIHSWVPDAELEFDASAHLIAFTYLPGTYRGLFVAVAPQRSYVNLMFSRGVELQEINSTGLLQGTGKKARHVKIPHPDRTKDPAVRALVQEAARRTPRL